jgi:hypothetical protein
MSNIFELDKIPDGTDKINMEDLYENKHKHDRQQLELFNKILCKIHTRIKYISNQRNNPLCCWHVIPETMIGVPRYNQPSCIAYVIGKLESNGFVVQYIHPNLLFISWKNYVPSYIRSQIKEKTGMIIDEHGQLMEPNTNDNDDPSQQSPHQQLQYRQQQQQQHNNQDTKKKSDKSYTPLNKYKPTGQLIYEDEYLNI